MTEENLTEKRTPGCFFTLVFLIVVCTFPIWWLKIQTVFNQLKWQNSSITNYRMVAIPTGMKAWPEFGIRSTPFSVEKTLPNTMKVEDLFRVAYQCILFCDVGFDSEYGYPNHFYQFFLEGGWLDITVRPIEK